MRHKAKFLRSIQIIMILISVILLDPQAFAHLEVRSVYSGVGFLGEHLRVTLKGNGFDANTRVSMILGAAHRRAIIGSVDTPGFAWSAIVEEIRDERRRESWYLKKD